MIFARESHFFCDTSHTLSRTASETEHPSPGHLLLRHAQFKQRSRIEIETLPAYTQMELGPGGAAPGAAQGDDLAPPDRLPFISPGFRPLPIKAVPALPVLLSPHPPS